MIMECNGIILARMVFTVGLIIQLNLLSLEEQKYFLVIYFNSVNTLLLIVIC
jgi:hypothetical protein